MTTLVLTSALMETFGLAMMPVIRQRVEAHKEHVASSQ